MAEALYSTLYSRMELVLVCWGIISMTEILIDHHSLAQLRP